MKNKVNPRSFTLIKFLLTLGLIFNYSISLISFINVFKGNGQSLIIESKTYIAVQILLLISSISSLLIFFFVRKNVHKKLNYKYIKREKIQILLCLIFISIIFVLSIIDILTFLFIFKNIYVMVIIFLIIQLILGVIISILESFSRLSEQVIANKLWFEEEEEEIKLKENNKKVKVIEKKDGDFNPFMQEEEHD
ncbi:hypothetical protein [Spiroplasma cantharicola]|uniref:Transmembrane protein n=1 Tax=Spiroplasma cantharicola TaxID=362837 RepID=A0A0M5KLL4_9MOLU|nr:hypothetical protein [Spiroplasma cantharicola]ALD66389.1 hypothetical protein SCANT_v1c04830 [Spiroplasma cantharicola]